MRGEGIWCLHSNQYREGVDKERLDAACVVVASANFRVLLVEDEGVLLCTPVVWGVHQLAHCGV